MDWVTLQPLTDNDVKYGDADCNMDYLLIPGGSQTGGTADVAYSRDRFCGKALGYCGVMGTATTCTTTVGPVTSKSHPVDKEYVLISNIFFQPLPNLLSWELSLMPMRVLQPRQQTNKTEASICFTANNHACLVDNLHHTYRC